MIKEFVNDNIYIYIYISEFETA